MIPAPLPSDALILGYAARPKVAGSARDAPWNGRVDLSEEEAWHLSRVEFDRFFAALVEARVADEDRLRSMREVRRKIANRESARLSRARLATEAAILRADVERLEIENACLRESAFRCKI